ncbi:macrolide transport system ATP-binding/permease protein [Desulfallas thermosapovorans DSM 6562]|uniref:Macrolide transport system ATP-binding/permease protein n=1 Tax=Desulfallas thermosapovorans DSM 6562 TaxID=1121431 RepID=A0A5S4ZNH4_9FIRM|nr:macrolide transport system ATP-binding/permease protein [Desulfallas thermosapovorans DSM 6562]
MNGAGKTTLVNILTRRLEPDEGWVELYGSYSYVSQLQPPRNKRISAEWASKLRVSSTWHESMSGGEKTRFKLAQCFDSNSLMIFADEPTSNIDMEGIELIENRLVEYQGGLVIVSHDRSLLDRLCNKIIEVENGKIKLYGGNYSYYSAQKDQERERAQFEYSQYVIEKKRLEKVIVDLKQKMKSIKKAPKRMGNSEARLHKMGGQKAKASLARAIKNTRARIEHLEVKEKPLQQELIKLDVVDPKKIYSKVIIEGRNINKNFGDKVIFRDAEFNIDNGAKVALIGPNGCGKSTLLKMIVNKDDGIKIAPGAKIGYFSQDMSILDESLTILENVMADSIYQETFARIFLSRLLFKREEVFKKVSALSGGERVKVSFAKILLKDFNLLILDEPTNYLDIHSLDVIEEALQNYNGTLLFASHDRKLISSVADHIMTIENHKIKMFNGNFADYLAKKSQAPDNSLEDIKKQIFVLQNRLSEIIGKLSMPSKNNNLQALDEEYHKVLNELKRLKGKVRS